MKKCEKENVLLAIPTPSDPILSRSVSTQGPILRALQEDTYHKVVLIGCSLWKLNLFLTEQAIREQYPSITIYKELLPVANLGDYNEIFYPIKGCLKKHEALLRSTKNNVVALLPYSYNEVLLDCWILALTSLNLKIRLCQVHDTYTAEQIFDAEEGNTALDWIDDKMELNEPASANLSEDLLPGLKEKLLNDLKQNSFASATVNLSIYKNSTLKLIRDYARKHEKNFLSIDCSCMPNEIFSDLLFGYSYCINRTHTFFKKGKLDKIQQGVFVLLHDEKLPSSIREKLTRRLKDQHNLSFVYLTDKNIAA